MRFTFLTPGTGSFYCGSCLRDDALARALRAQGHEVQLVPLYLPLVLEDDAEQGPAVHLGGINLFLRHKAPILRRTPRWIAGLLDRPDVLRWVSARGGMTDAAGLGEMALSMLSGEEGKQAEDIDELADWLAEATKCDVLCLSNALLTGMVRRLKEVLRVPVACTLQGEAPFLDGLAEPYRAQCWKTLAERAAEIDLFIPVSAHYGALMKERLGLRPERVRVVHNGIDLARFPAPEGPPPEPPAVGYLARLCADKGFHTLVEAFVLLKERGRVPGLKLRAAGALLAADRRFVQEQERRLERAGLAGEVEIATNVGRSTKIELLRSLTVFSVPATYGESFGLYLLEALACGVPVVEPRHGAFPELIEATGGGRLCAPDDAASLASVLEELLLDPPAARALGERGRRAVAERFTVERMAREVAEACAPLAGS